MKFYFDNMKTRNRTEFQTDKYLFVSYEDFFMGEWVGNINVFDLKTKKMLMHATTKRALSRSELIEEAKGYEEMTVSIAFSVSASQADDGSPSE